MFSYNKETIVYRNNVKNNYDDEHDNYDDEHDKYDNYDDRDYTDIFNEILEEIDNQIWTKSKNSLGFSVYIKFQFPLQENIVLAMKKVINIRNPSFLREFPYLKKYAIGIYICSHFMIIKASKNIIDWDY